MTQRRYGSTLLVFATAILCGGATIQQASADEAPTCDRPHTNAAVVRAAQPAYPAIAELLGDSGVAYVKVDLSPAGKVVGAAISRSSGSHALDKAALEATNATEFQPERINCLPTGGSYGFIVSFER